MWHQCKSRWKKPVKSQSKDNVTDVFSINTLVLQTSHWKQNILATDKQLSWEF